MCLLDTRLDGVAEVQLDAELQRFWGCLFSIASLLRFTAPKTVIVLADHWGVIHLQRFLAPFPQVHLVRVPLPSPPNRFLRPEGGFMLGGSYTFAKLHAWRLTQFQRLVWFDSDVFFLRSADPLVHGYKDANFAAVRFPFSVCSRYFNSGILLIRPSMNIYE